MPAPVNWYLGRCELINSITGELAKKSKDWPSDIPGGDPDEGVGVWWLHDGNDLTTRRGYSTQQVKDGLVPVYLNAIPVKLLDGTSNSDKENLIDFQFWLFYPLNGDQPGLVSVSGLFGDGTGSHVGDWEHVTVRVQFGSVIGGRDDGRAVAVFVSAHAEESRWRLATDVTMEDATHPVIMAGKHGHANYFPHPTYGNKNHDDHWRLYGIATDKVGKGTKWDTSNNIVQISYPATTNDLAWVNFTGRWGQSVKSKDAKVTQGFDVGYVSESPEGPIRHGEFFTGDHDKAGGGPGASPTGETGRGLDWNLRQKSTGHAAVGERETRICCAPGGRTFVGVQGRLIELGFSARNNLRNEVKLGDENWQVNLASAIGVVATVGSSGEIHKYRLNDDEGKPVELGVFHKHFSVGFAQNGAYPELIVESGLGIFASQSGTVCCVRLDQNNECNGQQSVLLSGTKAVARLAVHVQRDEHHRVSKAHLFVGCAGQLLRYEVFDAPNQPFGNYEPSRVDVPGGSPSHTEPVSVLVLGSWVVTACRGEIGLFDSTSLRRLSSLDLHNTGDVTLNGSGNVFFAGRNGYVLHFLIDALNSTVSNFHTSNLPGRNGYTDVIFVPSVNQVLAAADGRSHRLNADTGALLETSHLDNPNSPQKAVHLALAPSRCYFAANHGYVFQQFF